MASSVYLSSSIVVLPLRTGNLTEARKVVRAMSKEGMNTKHLLFYSSLSTSQMAQVLQV